MINTAKSNLLRENRQIKNLMFEVLFGKPDETFIHMINKSKEPICKIEEAEDGGETYYSFRFKRVNSLQELKN